MNLTTFQVAAFFSPFLIPSNLNPACIRSCAFVCVYQPIDILSHLAIGLLFAFASSRPSPISVSTSICDAQCQHFNLRRVEEVIRALDPGSSPKLGPGIILGETDDRAALVYSSSLRPGFNQCMILCALVSISN